MDGVSLRSWRRFHRSRGGSVGIYGDRSRRTASQASAQERDSPATVRVQVILGCSPLRPRNLAPPPARTRQKTTSPQPVVVFVPSLLGPWYGAYLVY